MTSVFPFGKQNSFTGRSRLYTHLTPEQLQSSEARQLIQDELVQMIIPWHLFNAAEEQELFDYYAGYHPAIANRERDVRGDVNNKVTFNLAKSFTRDITSYFLNKPVQYVHRDQKNREAAEALTNAFDAESKNLVDINIANNMSIVGVGYRGVFAEKDTRNGTHLSIVSLDPRETFVVWSPDRTVGPLYCVTFFTTPPIPMNEVETKTFYKVYTPWKEYEFMTRGTWGTASFTGMELISEKEANLGGNLPIIEYQNSIFRMGDWESERSIMDALDMVGSDSVNDVVQFVNSILLAQGFELDEATLEDLERNKVLNIPDVPPGVQVVVKYIAEQLDSMSIIELRDWLESTLRAIVGVPDRKQRGGGGADTGDAVFLRDGWQDIDLVAGLKEQYFIDSDRRALDVALYIMGIFNEIEDGLTSADFEIKFSRTKQTNVQAKAQAFSTLVGAAFPIDPEDALEFADLTNNVSDVIERSRLFKEEMQEDAMKVLEAESKIAQSNQPTGDNSKEDAKNNTQSQR